MTMRSLPKVEIKKRYFPSLILILLFSILLHEFGHALAIIIKGGRITSYELTNVWTEPQLSGDLLYILGGPIVTSLLCFLATYKIFDDENNSDLWLATIFSNLRPLILLMLYIKSGVPQDEMWLVEQMKFSIPAFFILYFLVFSLPIVILVKAPRLPADKKIAFYLYNIAIILAGIAVLNTLDKLFFRHTNT
jgi:hypothetical protein